MSGKVRIGLAALSMELVPIERRRAELVSFVEEAAGQGCGLVCFPEYAHVQRTREAVAEVDAGRGEDVYARYAELVPNGPTSRALAEACRRGRIWALYGLSERWADGRVTNSVLLMDGSGRVVGRHVKTHLAASEEGAGGIVAGDELSVMATPFGRIGVMICYEVYFPEVARVLEADGADWFFYAHADGDPRCLEVACARAFDSRMAVLVCGYVWPDRPADQAPTGVAMVDGLGRVVRRGENRAGLLVVELDPADRPREARRWDRPDEKVDARSFRWSRRRPELYGPLVRAGGVGCAEERTG